ncbi:4653_t:CDS:1, partial [Paraglomus occultum]
HIEANVSILSKYKLRGHTYPSHSNLPIYHSCRAFHSSFLKYYSSPSSSSSPPPSRLLISFTCKVCSHRQAKTMSKQAYDHGVVIIQCASCANRHLIADNLGWFRESKTNIETLMMEQGEKVKKVITEESEIMEWIPEVLEEERKKKKVNGKKVREIEIKEEGSKDD